MNWSLFQCFMTVAFFALACKILDLQLKSSRRLPRIILGTALILVFFASGITLDRGWPSRHELPNEFIFIHAVVQEPVGDKAGNVVVLIRTKENPALPYSVLLPYNEEMSVTWKILSMQAITQGEIPVSFVPGKGYTFYVKPALESDETETKSMIITPPKFRSA